VAGLKAISIAFSTWESMLCECWCDVLVDCVVLLCFHSMPLAARFSTLPRSAQIYWDMVPCSLNICSEVVSIGGESRRKWSREVSRLGDFVRRLLSQTV
jgi:hypothetical protein